MFEVTAQLFSDKSFDPDPTRPFEPPLIFECRDAPETIEALRFSPDGRLLVRGRTDSPSTSAVPRALAARTLTLSAHS